MTLDRTVFRLEVAETDRARAYWAAKPWIPSELRDQIGSGDVVFVPWENFREGKIALFPEGSSDVIREIRSAIPDLSVVVAIDRDHYEEIALYANEWRLPSLVCTVVIFPLIIGVVGNRIDRWTAGLTAETTVEMEIIVEGDRGKCFSLKYKGPPGKLVDSVSEQVKNCFDNRPGAGQRKKPRR